MCLKDWKSMSFQEKWDLYQECYKKAVVRVMDKVASIKGKKITEEEFNEKLSKQQMKELFKVIDIRDSYEYKNANKHKKKELLEEYR